MSPSLLRNSLFSFSVKTNWTRLEDLWGAIGSKHVYSYRTKNVNRATDTLGSIDMQGPSLHQWTFLPYDLKFESNVAFRGLEDFTHTSSTSQLTHSLYRRGMLYHALFDSQPSGALKVTLASSFAVLGVPPSSFLHSLNGRRAGVNNSSCQSWSQISSTVFGRLLGNIYSNLRWEQQPTDIIPAPGR